MRYIVGMLALLFVIPFIAGAENLDHGQNIIINCNDTDNQFNLTCPLCINPLNETCEECEVCDDMNVCSIDKELEAGERYKNDNGPCDIDIECEEPENECDITKIRYDIEIVTIKDTEKLETDVTIYIKDMFGDIQDMRAYAPFDINDTIETKYRYEWECPVEYLSEGVSLYSCGKFFDEWAGDENPVMYTLSETVQDCVAKLETSQVSEESAKAERATYQAKWEQELIIRDNNMEKIRALNETNNNIKSAFEKEFRGFVPGFYQVWAYLVSVVFAVWLIFAYLFGHKEGG